MKIPDNYIGINRQIWNKRTDYHVKSEFYDMDGFLQGKTSLNEIELSLLGNIKGRSILHLQCHFGQDTLSLARMGARVTGVDFSDKAINKANELADQLGLNTTFICCDIYDLPQHLDDQFDIIYTTYGTIGWLPDLDGWAAIIARFLKPMGRLVFVDFHPVVWMMDENFTKIEYSYFNVETIETEEDGSYADAKAPIKGKEIGWNHSFGEIFSNLLKHGITIVDFQEYDYSPYNAFKGMQQLGEKKYIIEHIGNKLPMVYSIVGER